MDNKKDDSIFSMIKLGLILAAFAAVSCTVLALVNNVTAPKIAENQQRNAKIAMQEVFESADDFEQVLDFESASKNTISIDSMYLAKKDGKVIGGAVQVTGPTYDMGTIVLGIDLNKKVTGMRILKLSDSPGFGLKANDSTFHLPNGKTFYGQFAGKNAEKGFSASENFDAISGATITSKGIAELMNEGSSSLIKYLSKIN